LKVFNSIGPTVEVPIFRPRKFRQGFYRVKEGAEAE
jgi:hypothetical protein